jgi:hypothetical protein
MKIRNYGQTAKEKKQGKTNKYEKITAKLKDNRKCTDRKISRRREGYRRKLGTRERKLEEK